MKTKIEQKCVADFLDYDFESYDVPEDCYGDYAHANFFKKYFAPILRSELKKMASAIGATLVLNVNHFEAYGFFCRDGKYVYFSISDVRYWDWYDKVLYRTAESTSDYTGGSNMYCSYERLKESVDELMGWM